MSHCPGSSSCFFTLSTVPQPDFPLQTHKTRLLLSWGQEPRVTRQPRTLRALFLFHELPQAANRGGKHKFSGLVLLQSPPKTHFWEVFSRLKGKRACPRSVPGRSPWDGLSQEVSPCTELHKIPQQGVLQGV